VEYTHSHFRLKGKGKGKVVSVRAVKAGRGADVQLHSLTPALDGGE
jgi:hypothetical protein